MINCEVCGVTSVVDRSVDPVLMCGDCASKLNRITQRGCANCAGLQRELKELRDWRDMAKDEIKKLYKRVRQARDEGFMDAAALGKVDHPMSVEEFQHLNATRHICAVCNAPAFSSVEALNKHMDIYHG